MVQGIGKAGAAAAVAAESTQVVNTPISNGAAGDPGGLLSQEHDAKESATAPKFGDVYKQIQAKYGAKPEKPREIKKTLGKDDFLRIMLTQMKNQDPTNPFKPEQMATEIAQFTTVEQLQNINQNLNKMEAQNKPFGQLAMTNLIGKTVTIDRERFPHTEGQNEALNFSLPKDAANTHIAIMSDAGDVVFEKDIGSEKAGEVTFSWDGLKSNTLPAKTGNYVFRIEAKDDLGRPIESNPQTQARVIGLSFEGSEPVFLVGDAKHYDKVTMRNIVRVDDAPTSQGPRKPPQSQPTYSALSSGSVSRPQLDISQNSPNEGSLNMPEPAPEKKINFIPYKAGVGSAVFEPQVGAPESPGLPPNLNKGGE